MRLNRLLNSIAFLIAISIFALPSPVLADSPPNGPVFDPFVSPDTFYICPGETIHDTVRVTDADPVQTITITKESGPGTFISTPSISPAYGYFEFTPETTGSFDVVFKAISTDGDFAEITKTYVVFENVTPQILSGDATFYKCWTGTIVLFPLEIYDPDSDQLTINVLQGSAWYDYQRKALAFYVQNPGTFCFKIEVADECTADTADICLTVQDNDPPHINGYTEKFYICEGEEICFTVTAFDPENDSLVIKQIQGPGTFTRFDNFTGQTCFYPEPVDSADYIFVYEVADSCRGAFADDKNAWPPGPRDTVIITVIQAQGLFLTCPDDTSLFLCEPQTVCIPIGDVPSNATITLTPEDVTFDDINDAVCFDADKTESILIKFIAENSCGVDTCEFTVDVTMNTAPFVSFEEDFSVSQCFPEEICVPVIFGDIDGNSSIVQILPQGAYYNEQSGTICFTPTVSGNYAVSLSVIDECEVTASDEIVVSVDLGNAPAVISIADSSVFLCDPAQICFPVSITDLDNDIVNIEIIGPGSYGNGYLCFMASEAGLYQIIIRATDACGMSDEDTTAITVTLNRPPTVAAPDDYSVFLCQYEQICFEVGFDDPDNNIKIASVSAGIYDPSAGTVCFTPTHDGEYAFDLVVTDSCYETASDRVVITVATGDAAWIDCPEGNIYRNFCGAGTICYDLTIFPSNAVVTVMGAEYSNGQICFDVAESGTYVIDVTAQSDCGTAECQLTFVVDVGTAPSVVCPDNQAVTLCEPEPVCLPLTVEPVGANVTITPFGYYENGQICFMAENSGVYEFGVVVATDCGEASCSFAVTVTLNTVPEITATGKSFFDCLPGQEHTATISATDADNDDITYNLLSGIGTLDPVSGLLTFAAPEAGEYCFVIEAADWCGSDTAEVCYNISLNSPPLVSAPTDTSIIACTVSEICIPVEMSDADNNIVSIEPSAGIYNNGEICFSPPGSGTYEISITVTDECGEQATAMTVIVVDVSEIMNLECPSNDYVFTCVPDTFCYPIGGIPTGATVTVWPSSAWFDYETGSVCFYTNCTVKKDLKVVVEGECSIDSCMFYSYVFLNRAPLVISAPDTTVRLCLPQEICIPVGVLDFDGNGDTVVVSVGATYNSITGRVCFTPTESGVYPIITRAIDECGLYDDDTTVVTVLMNEPPVVDAGADFSVFQCNFEQVCFPVSITDDFNAITSVTVSSGGTYNPQTGMVCFTPNRDGLFNITITAYDNCGEVASDIVGITIVKNTPPVVVSAPDSTVLICEPQEICFAVNVADIDDNIDNITVNHGGVYSDGFVCFTPATAGTYFVITTVTDICGASDTDSTKIIVKQNSAPQIQSAADFTEFQCDFEEICFAVSASDIDGNLISISSDFGAYNSQTGLVCFAPDSAGRYIITVTAVDACGLTASSKTTVTVTTGPSASIVCPTEPIDFFICEPQQVCVPLEITPVEAAVTVSQGTYADGQLCLDVSEERIYTVRVIADAVCGSDTCFIDINVDLGNAAQLTCPADTAVFFCEPSQVCRPIGVLPPEAIVAVVPIGTYADGMVCFNADSAGHYEITITAETECGTDECTFAVDIAFNSAPVVNAGQDGSYFQCVFEEICQPVTLTDTDNNITNVLVTPTGYYNSENGEICFTPSAVGKHCLEIKAIDACGLSAVDTVCFTITTGDSARIDCPTQPYVVHLCEPADVCIPFSFSPATAVISVSMGTYSNGQICFPATHAGQYNIRAIAAGTCASDTCDIVVSVIFDDYAEIVCPSLPISVNLCGPDSVYVPLVINPTTAQVTITPAAVYNATNRTLAFKATTSGTYNFRVIATAPCGADTCNIQVNVQINTIPVLTCPGDIDTLLCLEDEHEICLPVSATGSGVTFTVLPQGTYSGGQVCIPITQEGSFVVKIIATNTCGADTCQFTVNVTDNQAPELTVPQKVLIPWCEDDEGTICVDGIFATDFEDDDITITQTCGLGALELIRPDSGRVCFEPITFDTTYTFCFRADDGCRSVEKMFDVVLYPSAQCSICVVTSIETDSCYVVGSRVPVYVKAQTNEDIGGFDLLLSYDNSVMTFAGASKGTGITGWEYFTYSVGAGGPCVGCPEGMLRLVGIADVNNGPYHPGDDDFMVDGILATVIMQITSDQNVGGQFLPISFFWYDCGDNGFSDRDGNEFFMDLRIYNSSNYLKWDEFDEIHFPESARVFGVGAPDSCLRGDKITPIRCVEFYDGGICVKHPDEIDARGDLNLNGIPYEIADAVVFTNYFIYGFAAFTVNVDGQIAASDVNADGRALSVADLVYLIRVIVGDAQPFAKPIVGEKNVVVTTENADGFFAINLDSEYDLGAGLFVFEYDDVNPLIPELVDVPAGMEIRYDIKASEIRVLVYSMERNVTIATGKSRVLRIPYLGSGSLNLKEVELATYEGATIESSLGGPLVPNEFEVCQNYPNPFNPATRIDLGLPSQGCWKLTIINIAGQVVRCFAGESPAGVVSVEWNGENDAGQAVASGVYFYRAEFGDRKQTKKMIMLK
jgi:hypothetical protein